MTLLEIEGRTQISSVCRSHGIKTDSSCNQTEMCWLGRGRLNVTQERKRSMRVNLWLWQLLLLWTDAAPPPPLHPRPPPALPTPGKSPAGVKAVSSLCPWRKCGEFSHQMTALCIVIRRLMYLSWDHKEDWAWWNNALIPPASPHELNPFILSWINPSCYLALRYGIIFHKVYFCVNFCTCAKSFFLVKLRFRRLITSMSSPGSILDKWYFPLDYLFC